MASLRAVPGIGNERWGAHLIGGKRSGAIIEVDGPYRRLHGPDGEEYARFGKIGESEDYEDPRISDYHLIVGDTG